MTYNDLTEIDLILTSKTMTGKGSRFTHNEKLQFTKVKYKQFFQIQFNFQNKFLIQEENEQVSVVTSSTEEVV